MKKAPAAFQKFAQDHAEEANPRPKTLADVAGKRTEQGKRISIHLRLTKPQWQAIHKLALEQNITVAGFFYAAADQVFKGVGRSFMDLPDTSSAEDLFEDLGP